MVGILIVGGGMEPSTYRAITEIFPADEIIVVDDDTSTTGFTAEFESYAITARALSRDLYEDWIAPKKVNNYPPPPPRKLTPTKQPTTQPPCLVRRMMDPRHGIERRWE